MRHTRLRWPAAALMLCAAWLGGCATPAPRPPVADPELAWATRMIEVGRVEAWEIKGRLAVRTHARGGQANLMWRRDHQDHDINLYGPLGGGRVVLKRDAHGAELRDNKKNVYYAASAEELLYDVAGWRVPFAALQYWILGLPSPDSGFQMSLDAWGRLAELRQDGWDIRFESYERYQDLDLPRKIFLKAEPGTQRIIDESGREDDRVEVKLLVKHWII